MKVPSGEIAVENGADGTYMQFDCDCIDALPVCRAQCCALIGTVVHENEECFEKTNRDFDFDANYWVLHRSADGFCCNLNRETRTCEIYDIRPKTCQNFHCTRGVGQRGWKLANHVDRQSMF